MFETALVALDLAPAEEPIVDCLPDLRRWGIKRIVLAHVVRIGYVHGAPLCHEQDYVDWLERTAQPLRAAGFEIAVSIGASGVPAEEILALAAAQNASLVVIGSRGHNIVSRLFLGSVAKEVIRKSRTPLLLEWIEPTATETKTRCEAVCKDTLHHVLLATDFSAHASAAEQAAIHLATKAVRVDCLHVLEAAPVSAKSLSPTAAQAALNDLVRRVQEAGGQGAGILLEGKASVTIAEYAARHDASMIIAGRFGRSRISSMLIGSTAADLCERSGRPVLLIP